MEQIRAFCNLPWTRIKVDFNGNVNMCCHQSSHRLGNLFENTFEEIWFGPVSEEIRKFTFEGHLHNACKTAECPYTYSGTKNVFTFDINSNGYPTELEFDLHPSHCNFGGKNADFETTCIMCPRSYPNAKKLFENEPDKTHDLIIKVKPLIPYLKRLCVMGLSEIFWQDKIFEIFDLLEFKKHNKNILFWANTNGSVFTKNRMERFVDNVTKSSLSFSLDAATEGTYLKIRKNKVFDKVVQNLKDWNDYRKKLNTQGHKHVLNIFNNINILNVHEVPCMVKMASEIGVDSLILMPTHNVDNTPHLNPLVVSEENWKLFRNAEKEARQLAKELNFNINIFRPLDLNIGQKLYQITI